jgi:hypothetical protein
LGLVVEFTLLEVEKDLLPIMCIMAELVGFTLAKPLDLVKLFTFKYCCFVDKFQSFWAIVKKPRNPVAIININMIVPIVQTNVLGAL